jgi:hypothetical protein
VSRVRTIRHEFVDQVPRKMKARTLYISIEHATCIHACLCGCGAQVVTPLSPRQWALTYDGETVSLWPSVGSWHLPCQSHYIIRRSRVLWERQFSPLEIVARRVQQSRVDVETQPTKRSRKRSVFAGKTRT